MRLLMRAEQVLRGPSAGPRHPSELAIASLLGWTLVCGAFYGAVMGSFGGVSEERAWQLVNSGLKVPLLLLVTFALSLPSFFVLETLLGLRADFPEVVVALVRSQAALAIVLAALAPYTLLWYTSFADYHHAVLFNGAMFAVASLSAQGLLRRCYAPLIARNRRHLWLLRTWQVLYSFVAIQMAWVLRPFVGQPEVPVQFFRDEAWGNAYVVVAKMIWGLFGR